MLKMLSAIFVAVMLASLAGCAAPRQTPVVYPPLPVLAQIPVPTAYPLNTQQKMQAVHHWEVLAEDVACKIVDVLERRVVERQFPVHVAPSGATPFAKSFHSLLITKLVEKHVAVSNSTENAMVLDFDIDIVRHGERVRRTAKGLYRALAPDVYVQRESLAPGDGRPDLVNEAMLRAAEMNVDAGVYTFEAPRSEILITSSLLYQDAFLMRDSSIYYINDASWWHYTQRVFHKDPNIVNYQLVDR